MSPTRMSKLESGMRAVLAFTEAFNRHDVAGMMQLVSEDCTLEAPDPAPDGAVFSGKEVVTRYWQGLFSRSPEVHIEVEEVFGLGERCILRWTCAWTDKEGAEQHIRGACIFRVRGGLIQEQLSYTKGEDD